MKTLPTTFVTGMTLREYFAGMSLLQQVVDLRECDPELLAKLAVKTADALITELAKSEK